MKAAWLTDIHLDFLNHRQMCGFLEMLAGADADAVLIAGDIAQAPSVIDGLEQMAAFLRCPIYFVLGNHDYYFGSIPSVRLCMRDVMLKSDRLRWLNESGVVRLTKKTVLVGHDGWGDARIGNSDTTSIWLNDFELIDELTGLERPALLAALRAQGDEAAAHFKRVLPKALRMAEHVVVVTHVPPFLEAAWHEGKASDPDWAPFFTCKAAGDALRSAMEKHPRKRMTVLCGHTHSAGVAQILPNLEVRTGGATYGRPAVQEVFEWD